MASRDVELNLIGNDRTGAATRSAGSNLDQLGRKLNRFNATARRSMGRAGIDAGQSFVAGFISAVTLGRLGAGITRLSPGFSALGTRLGGILAVGLAGAFLAQAGTIIAAGLPVILGGLLLAAPLINLWKDQEKAVASLKRRAGDFLDFISRPLTIPFLDSLDAIGDGLDRMRKPLSDMMRQLGPALVPLTTGVMAGLLSFVNALTPAMPGITAGLKEWGKQAPRIGKGIGDAIAKLLEDPEGVKDAVDGMADGLIAAADAASDLAAALITISAKYRALAGVVDAFEQATGGEGGPLAGIANNIKRVGNSIGAFLIPAFNRGTTAARNFVSRVPGILASLPGRAAGAIRGLGNAIGGVVIPAFNRATTAARNFVSRVGATLRTLPGRAGSALSGLASRIGSAISRAAGAARSAAARVVSGVVSTFASLPGRVMGVISGLGSRIAGAISGIVSSARSRLGSIGGAGSWSAGAGGFEFAVLGGGGRTGGPAQVNVAAPIVDVRAFLDGEEIRAIVRATIVDENRRNAHRARVGRR